MIWPYIAAIMCYIIILIVIIQNCIHSACRNAFSWSLDCAFVFFWWYFDKYILVINVSLCQKYIYFKSFVHVFLMPTQCILCFFGASVLHIPRNECCSYARWQVTGRDRAWVNVSTHQTALPFFRPSS